MKLRSAAFLAFALIAGTPQIAAAADSIPVYVPPPGYSWTGCYIGGHVGGAWADKDWTLQVFGGNLPIGGHNADGFLGGAQAGCDYQFPSSVVVGVQGDFAWTTAEGSHIDLANPALRDRTHVEWLASVTGRLGYGWDRLLGYVKGGVAFVEDDYDSFVIATGAPFDGASETRTGWTVGIGGEYAITDHVSAFAEYNYYDFGTERLNFVTPAGIPSGIIDIDQDISTAKVGINIRF